MSLMNATIVDQKFVVSSRPESYRLAAVPAGIRHNLINTRGKSR